MGKLIVNDLEYSRDLDHKAMVAIMGSGLWGSMKKYSKKVGRYAKKTVQRKYRDYRNAYNMMRDGFKSVPGMLYRAPGGTYRSIRSMF